MRRCWDTLCTEMPELGGDVADALLAVFERVHDGQTVLVCQRLAHVGVHGEEGADPEVDAAVLAAVVISLILYLHDCLYT